MTDRMLLMLWDHLSHWSYHVTALEEETASNGATASTLLLSDFHKIHSDVSECNASCPEYFFKLIEKLKQLLSLKSDVTGGQHDTVGGGILSSSDVRIEDLLLLDDYLCGRKSYTASIGYFLSLICSNGTAPDN